MVGFYCYHVYPEYCGIVFTCLWYCKTYDQLFFKRQSAENTGKCCIICRNVFVYRLKLYRTTFCCIQKRKEQSMKMALLKSTGCFDMESVNVKSFGNFLRNNIPLVIAVSVTLVFTYGIRLFWYSIGIDTGLFIADKPGVLKGVIYLGRFGLSLLWRLWYIKEFNPFTAFFTAFCLIWFFTISWCYIIAIFCRNTGRNNRLIPFALLFMTSAVWAEQFYFIFQAAEVALMISICPYSIYFLYKGFLNNEKGKIAFAFISIVFMTAVYQSLVLLFCGGVFACFVLLQEYSEYEPEIYRRLCLKLFITLIAALAVYLFINRIIIPFVFHIEKSDYVYNMNQWGKRPIKANIRDILVYGYNISIRNIPFVETIVNPIIFRLIRAGKQAVENSTQYARIVGNVILLPAAICFIFTIIKKMYKKIPVGRRLLYLLAGIGVLLCTILLALASGCYPPVRSSFTLPFAAAFMVFYLVNVCGRKMSAVIALCALLTAAYQAQSTAQLFYSDQMRYNKDVRLANELDSMIIQAQSGASLPVALIGKYKAAPQFHTNFLQGEVIGHSSFEWWDDTTVRGLSFMRSLGMYYDMANDQQIETAMNVAQSMPAYPDPGCVQRLPDVIVVKLPD